MSKIVYYDRKEYYDALEAVILFIKERGLENIDDLDDREECESSVDWLLESERGAAFKLSAKYFSLAVKSKKEICVAALKNTNLNSKEYRDSFIAAFMKVIDDLSFIPTPRKDQIRRVVNGKRNLKDEQDCIVLLQNLLYAVLPRFFEKVNSNDIRALVASRSNLVAAKEESDEDSP